MSPEVMPVSLRGPSPALALALGICAGAAGLAGGAGAALGQSTYATPYALSTLAGSAGTSGASDGTGAAAGFSFPTGIAVDGAGNLYVSDQYNQTIRRITPGRAVSTLAGIAGKSGTKDGSGTAAQFNYPAGVAVDSTGAVYVAEARSCTIRRIAPNGAVTTLAGGATTNGGGNGASVDGTGTAAQFYAPHGIAVDGAGTLYVADTGNYTIRKVTSAGVVTTLAGKAGVAGSADGAGSAARFYMPGGIAVDGLGNLYVSDTDNCTIRKITPGGVVSTLAGTAGVTGSADGTGAQAQFAFPNGIAVDASGNVYVSDQYSQVLRRITPGGVVTTLAGSPGVVGSADGTGPNGLLAYPAGIAVDGAGTLYVTDFLNDTVRVAAYRTQAVPPVIATQPANQTAAPGSTVVFSVNAAGAAQPGVSYQWYLNNAAISGATGPSLLVAAGGSSAGAYKCVETNSAGSTSSQVATLSVSATSNPGRLVNLSVNSTVKGTLTLGLVIGGSGTSGTETLLIRAAGPSLAAFGVTNVLADPTLTVIQQGNSTTVATNAGWASTPSNQAQVTAADAATGAFPLTDPASKDSALVSSLPISVGGYTVQVSPKSGGSGTALAEIYDDTAAYAPASPRLVNVSCNTKIGANGTLTAGFVVGGSTSKTVLVRAVGPTLGSTFGVSGVMADPQITVQPLGSSAVLAANAGWGGDPQIASVNSAVGAFALASPTSRDSAVVLTLAPGGYTAQVASVGGTAGTVLVEVYEVP